MLKSEEQKNGKPSSEQPEGKKHKGKKPKGAKPKMLRWKGVLTDSTRTVRLVATLLLLLGSASLVFTQLGFVNTGLSSEHAAYAIVILLPVALASLLLGTLSGAVVGLFAGAILLLHATILPLNNYESSFITPLTSIVMLGITGFLLGIMFAFALRNNPSQVKRVIYIVIVCCVMSWLYSFGFLLNVIFQISLDMAFDMVEQMGASTGSNVAAYAERDYLVMALRMGHIGMQMLVDAILMAVFCCLVDYAAMRMVRETRTVGLKVIFGAWLSVVVLAAFMVTAPASFIAISLGEINEAEEFMQGEARYLTNQIINSTYKFDVTSDLLEEAGFNYENISEKAVSDLVSLISIEGLLMGYTVEEDGSIVVLYSTGDDSDDIANAVIASSDDERFPPATSSSATKLSDVVSADLIASIKKSLASGKMERTVYDNVASLNIASVALNATGLNASSGSSSAASSGSSSAASSPSDSAAINYDGVTSELAYVYAERGPEYTVMVMQTAKQVFADRRIVMLWTTLSSIVLLLAVFIAVFNLLNRVVVRRIDDTNGTLKRVTEGNLDARVAVRDTREFESLSDGINDTVEALKGWIAEAETRMDAELEAAKAIQESALPRTFPPFPDISKFDVYASMHAAKEVGGDFYDFFLMRGDSGGESSSLAFVVADVSGKGVPAALFMMKANTLIRDYLESGIELGEAIENANRQLCDGNDAGMFVTMWVGVLDYENRRVNYVNAGHNPPLLWQHDGGWSWLTEKSGLPLGLFDGLPYQAYSIDCNIGDEFLLYSDGVTEAMSVDGELYGEERLKTLADAFFFMHPRGLVETVRRDVARHAAGAEQSDDITILALEVGVPPELTATITVPADVNMLPVVNEFIHTELDRRLCPKSTQSQLDIAVEELFVNVAHYAYPDATAENPGMARISYTYFADPPSVTIDIADDGIPYNPLAKPDAVTPDDIMDVPIGGLGILMAKKSVDEMSYERVDGSNIVTIVKKW